MLKLNLTLGDKIHQGNQITNERLTDIRDPHNRLVKKVVSQTSDMVERDIRINNLESNLGNIKQSLEETRQDLAVTRQELPKTRIVLGDLIITNGMANSEIDYVKKVSLDQRTKIREKKIILAGIPESKGEKEKSVVIDNLRAVLKKSMEIQQLPGYNSPADKRRFWGESCLLR